MYFDILDPSRVSPMMIKRGSTVRWLEEELERAGNQREEAEGRKARKKGGWGSFVGD
jgi:hypothetical protein